MRGAIILMYHSVAAGDAAPYVEPGNRVDPRTFERQMAFLAAERRVMPLADHAVELLAQHGIAEHLQMGGEDGSVLLAEFAEHCLAVALNFDAGGDDCLGQSFELVLDGIARDEPARDAKSLVVHHQRLANGHAGRNGNSL